MNVIQFNKEMTRNEKLSVLLWDFFETHDVDPSDALLILEGMIGDIKDALSH